MVTMAEGHLVLTTGGGHHHRTEAEDTPGPGRDHRGIIVSTTDHTSPREWCCTHKVMPAL